MAKKNKIPRQYQSLARRSKNEQFKERPHKISSREKAGHDVEKKPGMPDQIRLNRYISNAGVCSRRDADELIKAGRIKVNGQVVTELGTVVKLSDKIEYEGKLLSPEKKVYLLLNKPKNVVTTSKDPRARTTVMDIIKNACSERVYPVGRLDRNTTGVLLITNDGDLSKRLTHPRHEAKKIYHVITNQPLTPGHLATLKKGIKLEDGFIKPDAINYADDDDLTQVGIEIHSGRNRIVRRMFEHLGYEVVKLDRVYFSGLTKKNLPRGKWRFLDDTEITMLKAGLLK